MKRILFLLIILISTINYSCKGIINPTSPYKILDEKVFYNNKELIDANAMFFETISFTRSSCESIDYGKDDKNVYFKDQKIEGVDAKSFVIFGRGFYKDKRYIYFRGKKLEDSDSRKDIVFIEDFKCTSWGDGGCILNNGFKYLNDKKI